MPAPYLHGVQVVSKVNATRPIRSVNTAIIGIVGTAPDADPIAFPLNTPVLVTGDRLLAGKLDTTGNKLGTLPHSLDAIFSQIAPIMVVIRVAEVKTALGVLDVALTQANVIGTVTASGQSTGMQALLTAESALGVRPRILGAPGWTNAQPVATAMDTITTALRGFAYYDLASADVPSAITARAAYGNMRSMLLFPGFNVFDTATGALIAQPASATAMGLRAKLDNDVGWHKTLSNAVVNGVSGLTKPISWSLQDPASQANLLNSKDITTMIQKGGYRFWGSRTPSIDPVYAFESAVRTGDVLADSIAEAHLWAMDKPMSKQLFDDIVEGVNAKFRELKAMGYIVDAKAWLNPDLNTVTTLAAGKLWVDYDYTPVPPLEQLGFNATITNQYLIELIQ